MEFLTSGINSKDKGIFFGSTLLLIYLMAMNLSCSAEYEVEDIRPERFLNSAEKDPLSPNDNSSENGNSSGSQDPTENNNAGKGPTSCHDPIVESTQFRLQFNEANQGCNWGQDGNLNYRDLHFQARFEEVQEFNLPVGSQICHVEFDFGTQNYYYDDEFAFIFNGVILASSMNFTPLLSQTQSFLNYEWSAIVGRAWSQAGADPYCLGRDEGLANCSWPGTSAFGPITLEYDSFLMQQVADFRSDGQSHEMRWVTTGDNDPTRDCRHSPIDMTVNIQYVR